MPAQGTCYVTVGTDFHNFQRGLRSRVQITKTLFNIIPEYFIYFGMFISFPDHLDKDADGDGILDVLERDTDGDGIPDHKDPDIDGDGIPNELDDDDDNDGILDRNEDLDGDGVIAFYGKLGVDIKSGMTFQ